MRAQSKDTALTISMKGVKIMDISQFLSASQVAELKAVSKVMEQFKTTELKSVSLRVSYSPTNAALMNYVFFRIQPQTAMNCLGFLISNFLEQNRCCKQGG